MMHFSFCFKTCLSNFAIVNARLKPGLCHKMPALCSRWFQRESRLLSTTGRITFLRLRHLMKINCGIKKSSREEKDFPSYLLPLDVLRELRGGGWEIDKRPCMLIPCGAAAQDGINILPTWEFQDTASAIKHPCFQGNQELFSVALVKGGLTGK